MAQKRKSKQLLMEPLGKPGDFVNEFVQRKKELVVKEYDSLFEVYGRETTIVYNFRGWAVILLTGYFTFIFTDHVQLMRFLYYPGIFIIVAFYFLEVSERSVMKYLLKELRGIEKIFMIENVDEFNKEIIDYQFRDLKDKKRPFRSKLKEFSKEMYTLKIVASNIFLSLIYVSLVFIYSKNHFEKSKAPTSSISLKK